MWSDRRTRLAYTYVNGIVASWRAALHLAILLQKAQKSPHSPEIITTSRFNATCKVGDMYWYVADIT